MKASLELSPRANKDGLFQIVVRIQDGNERTRRKTVYNVKKQHFNSQKTNVGVE